MGTSHATSSSASVLKKAINSISEHEQHHLMSSNTDRKSLSSMHRYNQNELQSDSNSGIRRNYHITDVETRNQKYSARNTNIVNESNTMSTSYRKEFHPYVQRTTCPAGFIEAEKNVFKHTRDTKEHKFYVPVVTK